MQDLMFLFIVDIVVGCHLVKGGERAALGKPQTLFISVPFSSGPN